MRASDYSFTLGRTILAGCLALLGLHIFSNSADGCYFTPSGGQLPTGYTGTFYNCQIQANSPDHTYSYTGTLPQGLTLDPDTGVLSGIPTQPDTQTFTVTASGADSCSATYTLTVLPFGPSATTYVGNIDLLFSGTYDERPTPGSSQSLQILGEYGSAGPSASGTAATTFPWAGWITDVQWGGAEYYDFTLYVLTPKGPGPNPNEQQFTVKAVSQNLKGFAGIETEVRVNLITPVPVGPGDILAFAGYGPNFNYPGDGGAYGSAFPPEQGYLDASYEDSAPPGTFSIASPPAVGMPFTVGLYGDPAANYEYVPGYTGGHFAVGVDVSATLTAASQAAPGQSGSVSQVGVDATLQNSGSGSETVTATAYAANPNGTAASFSGGPAAYVDLSVSPMTTPGDGDTLMAKFHLPGPQQSTPPQLYYFPNGGTTPEPVLDQNGAPIVGAYDSSNSRYIFSVTFNDLTPSATYPNSPPATTPTISQMTGTLLAMGTLRALAVVAPASAAAGQTVSLTVTALDGSAPVVAITASDPKAVLPGYVQLSGGTARFSVTFNTSGSQTVTATAAGYSPGTSSAVAVGCLQISVAPNTPTMLSYTVGNPVYLEIPAIGGVPPYTFSLSGGALPAGLILASEPLDGILSGTPTAPVASSPITITATDANGCAGSIGYTVTVSPAAPSSPIANNQSFATFDSPGAQVTLTGSDPNSLPLTYTVPVNTANGGELRAADPGWTSASIINGVLSIQWAKANNPGSSAPTLSYIPPDQPGADRFTFTVYDGAAYSAPATDSIAIVASGQPLVTSLSPQSGLGGVTALLSGAGLGQAVSAVAYAANPNGSAADFAGPAVFVDLAVSPQTALGDGHTVTATFYLPNFSGSPPPDLLYFPDGSTQWAYVLDQSGRKIPPVADSSINGYSYAVTFNDATPAAPGGMGTTPTVSQLNGTVFAMATPAVPSTATQLQVQAIPTTAFSGTTPVLVTVSALDASGNPATSSDSVTISSSDPIALFKANSLSQPFPLPQTVTLQNGTATFYVTFETVGQPTVTATDARLANPTAVSSAVTVTCPTITLNPTTGTLAGTVNIPYSLTITATGSGVPSTYTVTSGALPSGVSLNATTAVLSGTPSTPGNSTFTVTATDANGCTGNMSYTLAISPAPTSAYVGNDLSASYGGPDGDPPLVILGEYAPDSLGGPQANSSFNLPAGRISDLKFLTTAGENYNFTFYVLKPTGSPGQGEQTFEIVSSTPVAGAAQSAGLQTVTMTPSLPVSAGEVLAFLGVGPDYNSSDALGSDATYEDASEGPETFTATAPNGTSFTVGEHGDSATRYDYISDVFGNQGRTYAIGVDVSLPSSSAQQLLVVAPGQMFSPGTGITGQPRPQIPGRAVPVTVYAVDGQMNLVSTAIPVALQSTTEPTGSFQLSQTSTIESLPQAVTLSAGVATVYVTFHATGGQTVTASDPANNLTPGTTASISVVLPPVAINQTITIPENAVSVPLTLAGSDPNTPPFQIISYAVVPGSGPTQGVLGGTAPALTYTPQQNYVGADSFQFTVNNSYFDSLPATVSINVVQTGLPLTAQATGPAGQTITLIVPQVSDQAGLTASLVNTGPTAPTVAATAYLSNPEPGFTIGGPGTTFLDLSVFDPTDPSGARLAGDSMVAQFSYPAGLSTPPVLKYFTGSAWAVVLSSGSLPPTVDPAQHLMTVVFDNLSTPPVTSLNGTAFALVTPPVCEPPPLGVMNWWPGDGSPNSLNDIVGGNNATSVGDPVTYTTGIAGDGQAWSFDGNGFLATATEVNNPQSFTLECWFSTTTQQGGALLGFCDSQSGQPGNYDRFIYMDDNGYLHFGVYNNNLYTADSALAYNDGNWHHVAATISASGGANLYVDGALVANNPNASVAQNYSGYWRIGEDDLDGWPSQPSNADFNGAIAQVSIYSRPLSSVEIQALYNAGSAAKCESALASGLLTLGSTSRSEGPAIGSDSVVVGAAYPTTTWMAMSDSPAWLTAPSSGTGSGNAIFHYGPNPGAARTGNIVFTRGDGAQTLTLTVVQAGSTYTYETFTAPAQPLIPLASSGLNTPSGVGVDDGGNVYIADTANNVIEEWRYPGGSAVLTLPTQLASGGSLLNPSGVALDGQGNVYVADTGNNAIEQWTPGSPTLTTLVSSAQLPQLGALAGVAVDGGGNVYFCDPQNSVVYQWLPYGQIIALPTQLASGGSLVNPQGVAVDAGGNVYVADTGNGAIEQWTPGSTTLTTLVAPPSSGGILRTPSGVAVDAGGNVYIADSGANMIYEYTAATGNLTPLVSSGLNAPAGVALDGADDLYIADTANQAVEELPYGFVDPTPVVESAFAISGSFSGVLPATANLSLSGPFAPRFTATGGSAQSWLTLMPAGGGEVNFNLTPSATTQTGFLTLLGATIQVTQAALPAGYNSLTATATATAINLVFVGTPGATYVVQSAPALTGPWTALSGNLTADANGNLLFSDAIQPQLPARFYRTQCISGL